MTDPSAHSRAQQHRLGAAVNGHQVCLASDGHGDDSPDALASGGHRAGRETGGNELRAGTSHGLGGERITRLHRYEHHAAMPMTVLAVAFLMVYSAPIIWADAPDPVHEVLGVLNLLVWALFVADLVVRATLSGNPAGYVLRHPVDLLLVLLPMLRPLRVLRAFTAMQVLIKQGGRVSVGETLIGAGAAAFLLTFIGAVAALDAERGQPGALIEDLPNALWWAVVTITTVGYGDLYPVTLVGRWVAFVLMMVGISLVGVVTATIAAWFVGRSGEAEPDLVAEIRALRQEMAELRVKHPAD